MPVQPRFGTYAIQDSTAWSRCINFCRTYNELYVSHKKKKNDQKWSFNDGCKVLSCKVDAALNLFFFFLFLTVTNLTFKINENVTYTACGLAPAVRWSSCEVRIMAKLEEFVWEYLQPLLRIKNTVKFLIKIPHLTFTVHRLLSDRLHCWKEPILESYTWMQDDHLTAGACAACACTCKSYSYLFRNL